MNNPPFVRITRPYESVEAYLDAEADTIDHRRMLLIDAEPLPEGTLVRFSVTLATGEQVIKAEGRVRRHRAPEGTNPGGLVVQFKRFGASTKAFIDHAVTRHRRGGEASDHDSSPEATTATDLRPRPGAAPSSPEVAPSSPEVAPSSPEVAPSSPEVAPSSPSKGGLMPVLASDPERGRAWTRATRSTNHTITAPPDRDGILERLRSRARSLSAEQLASLCGRPRNP
ncbi:MAG: hypothetical protein JW751_32260 [Polyangiaceae bacterium]|nr:hypothetical protein [Polyangiaceae bacterium]